MGGGYNMNWAVYLWFGLLVAFVIAEAACPFHLVSVWFAVGALVATVISLLGVELSLQTAEKVSQAESDSHQCGCHHRLGGLYHRRSGQF